jgi:hypothetical protein
VPSRGVRTPSVRRQKCAVKALLDQHGRGGIRACSGRKPKGVCGSPNRGFSTPRSPGRGVTSDIPYRFVWRACDARRFDRRQRRDCAVRSRRVVYSERNAGAAWQRATKLRLHKSARNGLAASGEAISYLSSPLRLRYPRILCGGRLPTWALIERTVIKTRLPSRTASSFPAATISSTVDSERPPRRIPALFLETMSGSTGLTSTSDIGGHLVLRVVHTIAPATTSK